MSPTQRSLKYLRDAGWHVCVVERWIPRCFVRKDAFGWGDLLAVRPSETGAVLIQTTTGSNAAARVKKAKGNGDLVAWLVTGNRLIVHGWRKLKGRWSVAERKLTLHDVIQEKKP